MTVLLKRRSGCCIAAVHILARQCSKLWSLLLQCIKGQSDSSFQPYFPDAHVCCWLWIPFPWGGADPYPAWGCHCHPRRCGTIEFWTEQGIIAHQIASWTWDLDSESASFACVSETSRASPNKPTLFLFLDNLRCSTLVDQVPPCCSCHVCSFWLYYSVPMASHLL